jgi:hypothetical protein
MRIDLIPILICLFISFSCKNEEILQEIITKDLAEQLKGKNTEYVLKAMNTKPAREYNLSAIRKKSLGSKVFFYDKILLYETYEYTETFESYNEGTFKSKNLNREVFLTIFLLDDIVQNSYIMELILNKTNDQFDPGPMDMGSKIIKTGNWPEYENDMAYYWPNQENCEYLLSPKRCGEYRELKLNLQKDEKE